MNSSKAQCQCGKVKMKVLTEPLFRAFCHCSICQKFNNAEYGDIVFFRSSDVKVFGEENSNFKYHKFPPLLSRGSCGGCCQPTHEYLRIFPLPKLTVIPVKNFEDMSVIIPNPAMHIFYESRVTDHNDGVPKFSGYLSSQLSLSQQMLSNLRRQQ